MSTDQHIESEIQAKGLTAPRITPADIEANIASEHYFTAGEVNSGLVLAGPARLPGGLSPEETTPEALNLLTFCVLVLRNGFTVTGESACASPENFDAEVGRKIARANAINKVWPLLGYELRSNLAADAALRASMPKAPHGWAAYTGTKQLLAKPMTRGEYNAYRGWEMPENEDPAEPGYLVEYTDGGKANDSRHAGYISWSPADVFERAYRRLTPTAPHAG